MAGKAAKKKAAGPGEEEPAGPVKRRQYDKELARLHVELVKLQEWVVHAGLKVCIVFEGRDGAGKGGTIKAITERVSPRVFRVIALQASSGRRASARKSRRAASCRRCRWSRRRSSTPASSCSSTGSR
jgi:polyphosphate kinase 2 (PPK2 family)